MPPNSSLRANPSRVYLYPLLLGLALMVFSIIVWFHPRILLFLALAPVFAAGLGLTLFGLDLWRGIPDWRGRIARFCWKREDNR